MNLGTKTKNQIGFYIKHRVARGGCHREYENHKEHLEILCGGNWQLYEWAVRKLAERMGI